MTNVVRRILSILPDKSDLFLLLGTGFLFYGVYRVHPPSAFISVSAVCFTVAFAQSRAEGGPLLPSSPRKEAE